jgi:hypothetical protein
LSFRAARRRARWSRNSDQGWRLQRATKLGDCGGPPRLAIVAVPRPRALRRTLGMTKFFNGGSGSPQERRSNLLRSAAHRSTTRPHPLSFRAARRRARWSRNSDQGWRSQRAAKLVDCGGPPRLAIVAVPRPRALRRTLGMTNFFNGGSGSP